MNVMVVAIIAGLFALQGSNVSAQYVNEELAAIYGMSASTYKDTGTTNRYNLVRLNTLESPSGFTDGMTVLFRASAHNTGASTINVAGLGAKPLVDSFENNLPAGSITENELVWATYDADGDEFICHGAYKGSLNVKWFGATGGFNDNVDDAAAIQSAIDTAGLGGVIYFPAGYYRAESELTVHKDLVTFIGDGPRTSVIRVYHDSGYGINVEHPTLPGSKKIFGFNMFNMGMRARIETSGHALLNLNHVSNAFIDNVSLEDHFGGILVRGGSNHYMTNLKIFSPRAAYCSEVKPGSYYIKFTESEDGSKIFESFISNFNFRRTEVVDYIQNGIVIEACDGIWFSNGHVMGVDNADVLVNPYQGTAQVTGLMFDNIWFDGNSDYGLFVDGNSKLFGQIILNNLRTLNQREAALAVSSSAVNFDGISATGGIILKAKKYGALINGGRSHAFTGVKFAACNTDDIPDGGGLQIGGSVGGVNVANCIFEEDGLSKSTPFMEGIRMTEAASGSVNITGCRFNLTAEDIDMSPTSRAKAYYANNTTSKPLSAESVLESSLVIPEFGDYITVANGLDFNDMRGKSPGRNLTLRFLGTSTVSHAPGQIELVGETGFISSAGDTLTLVFDETNAAWYELYRCDR